MRQKFTLYLIMIFIMVGISTEAQVGTGAFNTQKWRFSDPKQFGFTVLDVHFLNNNFGIAVGGNGGIAITNDGGAKWQYGPFTYNAANGLKTTRTFLDVHIANTTVAYAVGEGGLMAKTIDAGQNWSFVVTPLFAGSRNINTCWFLNKDTGYIAGQFNTPDSLPKLYVTRNGGNTWDSLAAPQVVGKTRAGFVANSTYAPINLNMDAKAKEIYRIIFVNANLGYISGQSSPLFPNLGIPNITNATTCALSGTQITGTHAAALLWKFSNGTLTDYSISKERLGYTGINTIPSLINCTTKYGSITPQTQQYRAMNVYDDSTVVLMSFNNNTVVKVRTGRNDSTVNVNTGLKENGKYELLNYSGLTVYNPATLSQAVVFPPIPTTPQVLLASNPYQMRKSRNGKLHATANFGLMWTSVDTGRNWVQELSLPQGRNYSSFATWAFDILPSGKFVTLGQGGVVADSIPGGAFNSSYVFVGSGGNVVDFTNCNNGIVTGGASIAVTTNGGASWVAKNRADFASSFFSINGFHYTSLNKAYFAVSNGTLYGSPDQATTLDPIFSNFSFRMNDVYGFGTDTIYGLGYSQFSVPTASRKSSFFRSTNAGTTWQTVDIVTSSPAAPPAPAFTAPTLIKMAFPSSNVGYAIGSRNGVYKTTNGGLTWTSINPFPALNENIGGAFISYTGVSAIDNNTVFVVGNMFAGGTNVRRVYKTTDGGTSWTDIAGSINTQLPSGNMTNILFSDANNGYVVGSSVMFITNNSGTSWTMEIAPHGNIHNALGFAPRTVPASVPFANRKLFIGTISFGSGIPSIMEFGDTLNVNVNATEVITNANCTNLTAGAITLNTTGGIAPYTYSINGGPFQTSNTFTGLTAGVKSIVIKDNFCGTITKNITVGFTDNLTLTTNRDTSVCAGAPVQMIATSAANAYSWTPSAGLSNAAISNPVAIVNNNTSFTVRATLNSCIRTATVNITIRPNPVVTAGPDKTIVDGADVELNGSATGNTVSIAWSPAATLTGANTFTPIANPSTTTTYTMTVVNDQGCTSNDNTVVTVIPYCVKVMNAFTPNGDGINDRWLVTNGAACTNQITVKVFNRYGNEVYSNENYQNNWDGTYKGKPVPDGTYYYVINYRLISGRVVPSKGDVTILR